MELWQNLALAAGGLMLLLLAAVLPMGFLRFLGHLALNCVLGLLVLTVINLFSGATGVILPLNGMTLAVSGFLGIPGVAALAVMAAI